MNEQVIEVARFRLKPGVTEARMMELSRVVRTDFLAGLPGFLHYDLVRGDDGGYADVIRWASRAAVETAMARVHDDPACMAYLEIMEWGEDGMSLFTAMESHAAQARA